MTEPLPTSDPAQAAGPRRGRLFYVIGASGSGKDWLMRYARRRLVEHPIVFAHRYITRPVEVRGENHICLSEEEFAQRLELGLFAMNWSSHGLHYGIGIEIDAWLSKGLDVVMNGSRAWLPEANRRYPELVPVLIWAPPEALEKRIQGRKRESEQEISQRLKRAADHSEVVHPNLITVTNDQTREDGGEALMRAFGY